MSFPYIFIYSRQASIPKTQEIFELMIESGIEPSIVTYTQLLNMYGRSRDPNASKYIFDIFKRIKNSSLRYDTVAYSSLLSALGSSNDIDTSAERALEILQTMKMKGVEIDTQVLTIMIGILSKSKSNYSSSCFLLYDQIKYPTSVSFTTMLNFLKNITRNEIAPNLSQVELYLQKILTQMLEMDYVLDAQCLKSVASALSSSNRRTKVETAEILNNLTIKALNSSTIPDRSIYAVTFKAWSLASTSNSSYALQKSMRLLNNLLSRGIKPSPSSILSIFSILKRVDDSFENLIQSSSYFIDVYRSYNQRYSGRRKDDSIYFAAIDFYGRPRKLNFKQSTILMKKIRQLIEMMVEDNCDVGVDLYLQILKFYGKLSYINPTTVLEMEKVDALLRTQFELPQSVDSINCVIGAWAKSFRNDTIESTERMVNDMKDLGIFPNALTFFYIFIRL